MAPPDWSTAADGIPNVLDCAIGAVMGRVAKVSVVVDLE
jgi:hypothetical protein